MENNKDFKKVVKTSDLENVSGGLITYYQNYKCTSCNRTKTITSSAPLTFAPAPVCDCGSSMELKSEGSYM